MRRALDWGFVGILAVVLACLLPLAAAWLLWDAFHGQRTAEWWHRGVRQ